MTLKKALTSLMIAAFALTCISVVGGLAEDEKAAKEEPCPSFVGVKTCKMCHMKKSGGSQFGVWEKGPHATAYETLGNEESLALAKKLELGNPQEEAACLKCHVTAFPVMKDLETLKITLEEGVSCESCHGPGSDYKSKKTMTALFNDEISGESVGLREITEETCTVCHNEESPTYKEFDFAKRVAEVLHPYPEGYGEKTK